MNDERISMLNITMLGKLNITYKGSSFDDKVNNKLGALICLLVLNRKREMSREKIIAYLWPDSNDEAAKSNLRFNLWTIKKIIPKDRNGEDFIHVGKDYCRINGNYDFYCDKIELEKYKSCSNEPVEELIKLKELFKGDFLEGLYLRNCNEFNELILFERVVCQNKQAEILKKLVDLYEEQENYEEALHILNEIYTIEPYNENFAYRTIKMLMKLNNRVAAINYYKKFENNLRRNLDISPDSELKILYSCLLNDSDENRCENKKSTGIRKKKIEISSCCIKNLDFFWVADVVNEMLKTTDKKYLLELNKYYIYDLGYIQRNLLREYEKYFSCCPQEVQTVPSVRIAEAFIKFVTRALEIYDVKIKILNMAEMDPVSQNLLEHLERLKLENLWFEYEKK